MNYQKIHDIIINRARQRNLSESVYTENHHIIPKCEGGLESGETIKLTLKEHRLIHLLRYKVNHIVGNLVASCLMKNTDEFVRKARSSYAKMGAQYYHQIYRKNYPEQYKDNQKRAGKSAGEKSKTLSLGFFKLSEEELCEIRKKGRETIVREKIGMFSDEFREKHKQQLNKKINTPSGIFSSMKEAANFYNVVPGTITYRVKSENWNEWFYINEKGVKCE